MFSHIIILWHSSLLLFFSFQAPLALLHYLLELNLMKTLPARQPLLPVLESQVMVTTPRLNYYLNY